MGRQGLEVAMARANKSPSTHEEYVFHVRAPSLSYHFSIEHDRKRPRPSSAAQIAKLERLARRRANEGDPLEGVVHDDQLAPP